MQNYENYVKQDSETDKRRNSAAVQSSALEMQVSLGICTHVQDVCWNSLTESLLISVQDEVLKLWDLNGARDKDMDILEGEILATTETNKPFTCGCWDPISPTNFIAGIGTGLGLIDTRTKPDRGSDLKIENAHLHKVLDVDANPNKPYHVISGGKDCLAKIWDLRRPMEPMTIIAGHSHWVTNVKYNRFHDQLILTAGTDSLVNLWSLVSISSAPLSDLEGNIYSPKSGEQDRLIRQFEEHEESVYTVDWSASDAWVFASLSYDGRVLFNRVPQGEKYKILL